MKYTPEQMRGTAIDLEKYGVRWPDREMAAQLRQGADAVERVKVLEAALKDLRNTAGTAILMLTDLGETSPAIDAGYVQRVATEALTETKP